MKFLAACTVCVALLHVVSGWIRRHATDVGMNEGYPIPRLLCWGRVPGMRGDWCSYLCIRIPGVRWDYSVCHDDYRWLTPLLLWRSDRGWQYAGVFQ